VRTTSGDEAPDAAHRSRCVGAILAGGANTRFHGRAKGLEIVGGSRIVDRVASALRATTDELLIVVNDPVARDWVADAHVVADVRSERGSLVGVHTALARADSAVVVAAWDMPFVSEALLAELRREGEARGCAAVPCSRRGVEPLCAYYPRSALAIAERMLDAGEMRLSVFVDALPCVVRFDEARVAAIGDPERIFLNVNDTHGLARARAMAEHDA
jgi:molybdopterin-guanine dinucleotide biosynthesis protein A